MEYVVFFKCLTSGFLLAAPIGPVNLICIRSTLNEGRLAGLTVGLGAAVADALYGYAAAAGLTFVRNALLHHEHILRWGGGLFIIYLGYRTFHDLPADPALDNPSASNLPKLFASILCLTLANPVTIFTFMAAFSSFGIARHVHGFLQAAWAAVGVLLGSALWWLVLTGIISLFRCKATPETIVIINKISGIIIMFLGVVLMVSHKVMKLL